MDFCSLPTREMGILLVLIIGSMIVISSMLIVAMVRSKYNQRPRLLLPYAGTMREFRHSAKDVLRKGYQTVKSN